MPASGFSGTLAVMCLSLVSGLLSGLTASLTDVLTALNQHLTPVTASLVGSVVVGLAGVLLREIASGVRWWVERRERRKGG